jgi:hypothetical protein
MLTKSRIAALAAAFAALVIIGCMPALAQQTGLQQFRQQLSGASEALETESYAEAELALRDAQTDLEGAPPSGARDQLRVLIEAALTALENEDYATALQTLQEAERIADEHQASAPVDTGPPPTVLPGEIPSRGIGGGSAIRAARLFAGPDQYPPEAFAAYGIVAFRARASSGERERHVMLCEAYVATLPRSAELTVPVEEQMVTVWPIDDDKVADELNQLRGGEICDRAVGHYGLPTALQAIGDAGDARLGRDRRGPFLLAWSPSGDKGDPEALMLIADLTDVTTYAQAEAFFVLWRTDIEANPEYWNRGWNVERLRVAIQLWVDRYGSQIFSVLGG